MMFIWIKVLENFVFSQSSENIQFYSVLNYGFYGNLIIIQTISLNFCS